MIHLEKIRFRDPHTFRMLAITDMHIGDPDLRTPEHDYLDLTLRNIEVLQPDIVINAGDIVHVARAPGYEEWLSRDKHAAERLLASWELYKKSFVDRCPVPLLDVCLERDKPWWSRTRGIAFSHGYESDGASFIALCLDEDVRIGDSLLGELEQHAVSCGGTIVLATHYPVRGTCERDTVHWVRQNRELKQLISTHCQRGIVVAGHWHKRYFTNPPVKEGNVILCFGGEASTLLDNEPWGKVIDCHEDSVTISHWDFGRQAVTETHVIR